MMNVICEIRTKSQLNVELNSIELYLESKLLIAFRCVPCAMDLLVTNYAELHFNANGMAYERQNSIEKLR